MHMNIGKEVAALQRLSVPDLHARYAELFGERARTKNKTWLVKRLAWRMQALAEGDLSERARQRAAELANDADLRMSRPKPAKVGADSAERTEITSLRFKGDDRLPLPGTIITRPYKGETLQVKVLPKGFEYQGEVYKSLSAVAKAITGSHCNGYLFFRLAKEGETR
jgi:hypothetical protein